MAAPVLSAWRQPAPSPDGLINKEGRYVPLLMDLRRKVEAGGDSAAGARQMLAHYLATIGDEPGALAAWEQPYPPRPRGEGPPDLTDAVAEDAVEAIAAASKGRRVVMLNEAHHLSCNRAFAERVALRLREDGFSVLAAETFEHDRPYDDGVIGMDDGFYLRDPVYASMARVASRAGYRLTEYEVRDDQEAPESASGPEQVATREEAQANNLIAGALADPKARVLVYCGFAHLAKKPTRRGDLWFAARLKAKTGIDPLTIEQSAGAPASEPARDDPTVAGVMARFRPNAPVVVWRADGSAVHTVSGDSFAADLSVFHPRLADRNGRPGWLAFGRRREVRVDLAAAPPGAVRLLQAVPAAELAKAAAVVPADQYLLTADAEGGFLWLTPGRYVLRVETPEGFTPLQELTV
ncbi:hypothetical protein GVN21_17410 [Caulobacter sp. SLTY]|uniref:hypothetical protein n=1 Tax=Caulobacter sp. SLTY TaxID=2683262 RepID=UPI0014121E13|nr:hypothetical protein [Caulobacter sp. SLTY]NBB17145.1 hypothetical protein [Caulobacter sp. SLTY]